MTRQALRLGWLSLVVGTWLSSSACSKSSHDDGAVKATAPAPLASTAAPELVPSSVVSAAPRPPAREPTCRALRVEGEARVGDSALASGTELDGSQWVSLAKDASLTLKHASSGREIAIAGPALFRACRRGREQVLLVRGKVAVGSGMGARPGAEVLIATPVAGVSYAEASFSLVLDDKRLSLQVQTGQVEVEAAASLAKPPKSPLRAKDKAVIPLGKPDPALLMQRCQQAAQAAEASARRVAERDAPEPLGERAQAHVRARKAARSACTIAASATGLVADPTEAASLWAEAARWEGLWEMIPHTISAQPPEK